MKGLLSNMPKAERESIMSLCRKNAAPLPPKKKGASHGGMSKVRI